MSTTTLDVKGAEISALKSKLYTFPAGLHEAKRRRIEATEAHAVLAEELKQAEAEVLTLVCAETTPDGKPRYSNETARKAEVSRRLAADPAIRSLADKTAAADHERLMADLEVQRHEDEYRAWRAIVELTVAEVDLLTAGR